MTISKNSNLSILGVALAVLVMLAVPFLFAPQAHAADYDSGEWYVEYAEPVYEDTGSWYVDYAEPAYNETGSWYVDYAEPSYSNYGYSSPSYGYSTLGGYSMPLYGGSTLGGSSRSSSYSNTSVFAPTNTCTAFNSCNTTYDDHSVFNAPTNIVTTNPAPQTTVVYAPQPTYPTYNPPVYNPPVYQPSYDLCYNIAGVQSVVPAGYYVQGNNCFYQNYTQPVQPIQPYVTLSAVPYTGLELTPMQTAMYWGFLVLWCLIAAYLIAVKKVQNKIAAWFTGSTPTLAAAGHSVSQVAHTAPVAHAHVAQAHTAQFDGIDPFIQSQINRTK